MSEPTRKLAAILAADVAGYSKLMGEDEARTLAALRELRGNHFQPTIAEHRGSIIKSMGDGWLVEFASVVDAVNCAIHVQENLAGHEIIQLRMGIHIGDIVHEDEDIYGDGVNIAARLQEIAAPGGIALSDNARRSLDGKLAGKFRDAGEMQLKNIAEAVRVFRFGDGDIAAPVKTAGAPELPDKPSIAVLPFDNMSGDLEQEYFSDGLTEDIITSLSKLFGLLVIARNSSFVYKGTATNIQTVAKELGVKFVLEGSVRKAGIRVRITAQLVECDTGGHVWAERYDRDLTDIFALQDEVTQEIVSAMAVQLTHDEKGRIAPISTDNIEAYDYFLRGREQFWLFTKAGVDQADGLLRQAITADPDFPPSYAFLSHVRVNQHVNHWYQEPEQPLDEAFEFASQAVKLDQNYPKAHSALGNTHLWRRQHDLSIEEYQKALALDPNFALGFMEMGRAYHYAGRSSEAIQLIQRAMHLDPHYPRAIG